MQHKIAAAVQEVESVCNLSDIYSKRGRMRVAENLGGIPPAENMQGEARNLEDDQLLPRTRTLASVASIFALLTRFPISVPICVCLCSS